jgi:hypothetical protein
VFSAALGASLSFTLRTPVHQTRIVTSGHSKYLGLDDEVSVAVRVSSLLSDSRTSVSGVSILDILPRVDP